MNRLTDEEYRLVCLFLNALYEIKIIKNYTVWNHQGKVDVHIEVNNEISKAEYYFPKEKG